MLGFLRHHQPTVLCLFLWLAEVGESLLHTHVGRLVVRHEPQHDDLRPFETCMYRPKAMSKSQLCVCKKIAEGF